LGSGTAGARILAFTSGLPEEGKSTVVLRLAEALATSGSTVALVDCDVRRPMLHRLLGLPGAPGLTDALTSGSKLADSLVETDVPNLKLLPAGPMTDLPGVMPGGEQKLEEVLSELALEVDYVVVDTAPVTIGADASTVAAAVDSAFLVVDATTIDRGVLAAAAEQLHRAEANLAGVVLNRSKGLLSDSAYQGYYAGTMAGVASKMPAPKKPGNSIN
jgi:capsular exopolysaccharide synthesis family protein